MRTGVPLLPSVPLTIAILVSGGADGMVRTWKIGKDSQVMESSMKEHKSGITSLTMSKNGTQCLTSSTDGSCIVWQEGTYSSHQ